MPITPTHFPSSAFSCSSVNFSISLYLRDYIFQLPKNKRLRFSFKTYFFIFSLLINPGAHGWLFLLLLYTKSPAFARLFFVKLYLIVFYIFFVLASIFALSFSEENARAMPAATIINTMATMPSVEKLNPALAING